MASDDQVGGDDRRSCARKGTSIEGRLPPPKGAPVEDWEDREQTLFRATEFGDDVDRPLKKSDGSYTYFASDIAYHQSKIRARLPNLIDVWGADHGGYVKRMQAAVKAISGGKAELDVKIVQLVKLLRAGEPVKMSKRAGDFVTLREVVDEVGRDAVRFMMLYRKNDAVLDFDFAKVQEQSRDNPVFYVQYGHARGQLGVPQRARRSVPDLPADRRRADGAGAGAAGTARRSRRIVPDAPTGALSAARGRRRRRPMSRTGSPFICMNLRANSMPSGTRGKDLPHLRFIIQNDPLMTMARLALVQGVVTVLASGLALLGVEAPEEMR